MPTVSIDGVEAGAVLLRPVEDSMGRVLINAGETLTPQLIAVLKKRGFAEVDVSVPDTGPARMATTSRITGSVVKKMSDDVDVIKLREEIEARFHNVSPNDPRMQVIRQLAEKVLIDRIAKQKGMA